MRFDVGLRASVPTYIQTDHLNTPRWITDDAGTRIWSWESDAFGTTAPNADVDLDGIKFHFYMRFPGQYFDGELGMHYNYFRDYEPGTGRYLESDPTGLDGGINTFGYVGGNPLIYSDFFGLKWVCRQPTITTGRKNPINGEPLPNREGCKNDDWVHIPDPEQFFCIYNGRMMNASEYNECTNEKPNYLENLCEECKTTCLINLGFDSVPIPRSASDTVKKALGSVIPNLYSYIDCRNECNNIKKNPSFY